MTKPQNNGKYKNDNIKDDLVGLQDYIDSHYPGLLDDLESINQQIENCKDKETYLRELDDKWVALCEKLMEAILKYTVKRLEEQYPEMEFELVKAGKDEMGKDAYKFFKTRED